MEMISKCKIGITASIASNRLTYNTIVIYYNFRHGELDACVRVIGKKRLTLLLLQYYTVYSFIVHRMTIY